MAHVRDEPQKAAIPLDGIDLPALVGLPEGATGLVVFVHGSGSSRLSPRNRSVADRLGARGFATLLFDLLTEEEAQDRRNVFDIPLLARRVAAALRWKADDPALARLPTGLFGASTGAGAALVAAARVPDAVQAVVSRGGRPDLAGDALTSVRAPVLLIVGGEDHAVLGLNDQALAMLRAEKELVVVPGATHLFEEPGTLEAATTAAAAWFERHLAPAPRPAAKGG